MIQSKQRPQTWSWECPPWLVYLYSRFMTTFDWDFGIGTHLVRVWYAFGIYMHISASRGPFYLIQSMGCVVLCLLELPCKFHYVTSSWWCVTVTVILTSIVDKKWYAFGTRLVLIWVYGHNFVSNRPILTIQSIQRPQTWSWECLPWLVYLYSRFITTFEWAFGIGTHLVRVWYAFGIYLHISASRGPFYFIQNMRCVGLCLLESPCKFHYVTSSWWCVTVTVILTSLADKKICVHKISSSSACSILTI